MLCHHSLGLLYIYVIILAIVNFTTVAMVRATVTSFHFFLVAAKFFSSLISLYCKYCHACYNGLLLLIHMRSGVLSLLFLSNMERIFRLNFHNPTLQQSLKIYMQTLDPKQFK